jgi:hypothetical protein
MNDSIYVIAAAAGLLVVGFLVVVVLVGFRFLT